MLWRSAFYLRVVTHIQKKKCSPPSAMPCFSKPTTTPDPPVRGSLVTNPYSADGRGCRWRNVLSNELGQFNVTAAFAGILLEHGHGEGIAPTAATSVGLGHGA
jgi:hypothetical protein